MKYKNVLISGFAFNEKGDMKKLQKLAKQGWILEGVCMPILSYKLKKGEPQNLEYTLDYQSNYDEEYFSIFKQSGWNLVVTMGDQMHIFSAAEGTKPIYSDSKEQIEQYLPLTKECGKGAVIASLTMVLLFSLVNIFDISGWKLKFLTLLSIINMVAFVFTFLPYLGYKYRISKMKKEAAL